MWRRLSGVLLLALLVPSFCFSGELDLVDWAMTAPRDQVAATLGEAVKMLEMLDGTLERADEKLRMAEEKLQKAEVSLASSSAHYESALAKQAKEMAIARKKTGIKWGLYGFLAGAVSGAVSVLVLR